MKGGWSKGRGEEEMKKQRVVWGKGKGGKNKTMKDLSHYAVFCLGGNTLDFSMF